MSFTFGRTTTTSNSGSATAHNKYGGKFYLATPGVLQSITARLSCDVGGSSDVRYGCYACDENGWPAALMVATWNSNVPAGSSEHSRTIAVSSPTNLGIGWYELCVHAGASYLNIHRDLTGGNSAYVWDEFTGGLSDPWGTYSGADTKHYCIYGTLTEPNQAPYAPSNLSPKGGALVDVDQAQTMAWLFGDPDSGDTQAAFEHRYREVGAPDWITTGWVSSPYAQKVYAGGTFASAVNYEHQCRTKDNHGAIGPWCSSALFTGVSAPGAPTITDPANEQTVSSSTYEMDWSIADQDAWQGRRMNDDDGSPGSTVYEDTGTVEEPDTRSKTWTLAVNDRTEHWQVRVRHDSIWGDWASVKVNIAFTAPETPLLEVTVYSDTPTQEGGYISLEPTQPTPGSGKPTVVAIDVYRTETDSKDDAIRIAANLDPEGTYNDWEWARFKSYKYYIVAIGDNGATAESDLEG